MKEQKDLWIYILELENGNYYTGYTTNVIRRYQQHLNGKAHSRYTRSFKPVRIAQCWRLFDTVGTALKVERFIKKQNRKFKEYLVDNPHEIKAVILSKLKLDLNIVVFDHPRIEEIK